MVFLLEVEGGSLDTRPTDDVDIVVDLRVEPAGLARVHQALIDAGFGQVLPSTDGIAHRYTRACATIDVLAPDRLGSRARLALGGGREQAHLTRKERSVLERVAESPDLSTLAQRSIVLLAASPRHSD